MKFLFFAIVIIFYFKSNAAVQSEFKGPIELKVWKHWQQSWNVEQLNDSKNSFTLTRGTDAGIPYVHLSLRTNEANLTAQIRCDSYKRKGEWTVEENQGVIYSQVGKSENDGAIFKFSKAIDCVDKTEELIVTSISINVFSENKNVFTYQLKPMYVRGSKNSYWNNPIDPYSAHSGKGAMSIATSMTAESGWDMWNGVLVKPVLNFVDRNTLSSNSFIGLHRHESNQELYFVESGQMRMFSGVAYRSGSNYNTSRIWDSQGQVQNTEEFKANGGWIEERILEAGELSVIVPNQQNPDTVYFHGIQAQIDSIFWTMGSKN